MVYVQDKDGKPLMPTERHGKVRRMLKDGRAVVVRSNPFTIRLTYETTHYTQPIRLGLDAGYSMMGFAAVSGSKELRTLLSLRRLRKHCRPYRLTSQLPHG